MNTRLVDNTVAYMQGLTKPENRAFVQLFAQVLKAYHELIVANKAQQQVGKFEEYKEQCWIDALKRNDVIDNDDELMQVMAAELDAHGAYPMEAIGYSEEPSEEMVKVSLAERCVSYVSRYYLKNGSSFVDIFGIVSTAHSVFEFALQAAIKEFAGRRGWEEVYYTEELQHDLLWR